MKCSLGFSNFLEELWEESFPFCRFPLFLRTVHFKKASSLPLALLWSSAFS